MQEVLCPHLDLPLVKSHLQHRIISSLTLVTFSNFNPSRELLLLLHVGHDYSFCCLTIRLLAKCFLLSWVLWLSAGTTLAPTLKCGNVRVVLWSALVTVLWWSSSVPSLALWSKTQAPLQELKIHFRPKDNNCRTLFYHFFPLCHLNFSLAS